MSENAIIIPVAAGKGGVGKTFLAANLAIALAQMGHVSIAVDLDLGGSNLHSMLGLPNRFPGVGDFLKARQAELSELLVNTNIPNLSFIAGDGKTPFMANIAHAQKTKLINRLQKLPAEFVILDLGAGSTFNTLDFFALSNWGVVVTTPEPTAIMGMLVFLKNFLLRQIDKAFAKDISIKVLLKEIFNRPIDAQAGSISGIAQQIKSETPEAEKRIQEICAGLRPRIVFNMADQPQELNISAQIDHSLWTNLNLRADYFGFIFEDKSVRQAIRNLKPFQLDHPGTPAANEIAMIAKRMARYWNRPVEDSAARLMKHLEESRVTP